eukprot:TRINITY_DN2628_c0_g1_i1.p2 TRINITY_DN2628_c0_g1~~TRINITY_DN2628_c0_g1_i1.p2  ORF type:complete len:168 (-),score=27.19 TRINITY_DN2628_c0_g1_i1:752-1255(-)
MLRRTCRRRRIHFNICCSYFNIGCISALNKHLRKPPPPWLCVFVLLSTLSCTELPGVCTWNLHRLARDARHASQRGAFDTECRALAAGAFARWRAGAAVKNTRTCDGRRCVSALNCRSLSIAQHVSALNCRRSLSIAQHVSALNCRLLSIAQHALDAQREPHEARLH